MGGSPHPHPPGASTSSPWGWETGGGGRRGTDTDGTGLGAGSSYLHPRWRWVAAPRSGARRCPHPGRSRSSALPRCPVRAGPVPAAAAASARSFRETKSKRAGAPGGRRAAVGSARGRILPPAPLPGPPPPPGGSRSARWVWLPAPGHPVLPGVPSRRGLERDPGDGRTAGGGEGSRDTAGAGAARIFGFILFLPPGATGTGQRYYEGSRVTRGSTMGGRGEPGDTGKEGRTRTAP